jgi:hypothetical protein
MPTVLRVGPYRFFFYSADGTEPPHVQVERDAGVAKFWLGPVRLQESRGFGQVELGRIEAIVRNNVESLTRFSDEFFAG